jgi:hypothetical protein
MAILPVPKKRTECGSVFIADLGRDRAYVEAAAMKKRLGANNPLERRRQRGAALCGREPLSTIQTRFAVSGIAEAL